MALSRFQLYGRGQTSYFSAKPIRGLTICNCIPVFKTREVFCHYYKHNLKWVVNYLYRDISLSIQPSLWIPTTLKYSPLLPVSESGKFDITTIDQSDTSLRNRRFVHGRTIETLTAPPHHLVVVLFTSPGGAADPTWLQPY